MPLILAIDFDSVLHDWEHPVPGRKMGPPIEGAKDALIRLKAQGYTVIIWSCNRPQIIRDWMLWWGLPFDSIWGERPSDVGKPAASCYIDNNAIRFENWAQTLDALTNA